MHSLSSKDRISSRRNSHTEEEHPEVNYTVDKTQAMLDSLKQQIDLPVNFKPKTIENPKTKLQFGNKIVKNEEYYLE